MTRAARRRFGVVGASALAGVSSPLWGPLLLRAVPAFDVRTVEVSGAHFVDPEVARSLAAVPADASMWDDPAEWEDRVRAHPLVADIRVRRSGLGRLTPQLYEVVPIALVPNPVLAPVDAAGRLLPIDPARRGLDLPILTGVTIGDHALDGGAIRVLEALERLRHLDPAFVTQVSELRHAGGDVLEVILVDGSRVERIFLPLDGAVRAFLRVESAVRSCETRGRVVEADARFRDQVVIRMGERT